jgi:hypothetical protein
VKSEALGPRHERNAALTHHPIKVLEPAAAGCRHWACRVQQIVEKIEARSDDVLGHGRAIAELVRPMWDHDEARAIQECTDIIEKYVGVRPTGWMNDAIIRLPHDAVDGNE